MNILLAEDDFILALDYTEYIESLGHTVVHARNAQKAIGVLNPVGEQKLPINAIVTDMRMPGGSGLYLLQFLSRLDIALPCLVHSSISKFDEGQTHLDDLTKIGSIFHFARFHLKGGDRTYIKSFLELVQK